MEIQCPNCGCNPQDAPYYMVATHCPKCGHIFRTEVKNMDKERLEELLIKALEWTIDCSEQATRDLIVAIGITCEELNDIGYDEDNFPEMYEYVKHN